MVTGSDGSGFNFSQGSGDGGFHTQAPTINTNNLLQALLQQVEVLSDIVQDQRDAALCSKPVQPLEFSNKGNKIQFDINLSAINTMKRVIQYVQASKADKAIKLLNGCIDDLDKRNKCILIAEQSDSGWTAVDFFLRPRIGSNDEEIQQIKHANTLARAALKRKHEAEAYKQRSYKRGRGGSRQQQGYSQGAGGGFGAYPPNFPFVPNSYPFGFNPMQQFQPFQQQFPPAFWPGQHMPTTPSISYNQQSSNNFRAPPQCYRCLQIGHIQKNCPLGKPNPLSSNVPYRQ